MCLFISTLYNNISAEDKFSSDYSRKVEFSDVYKPTDDVLKFIDDLNKAVESKDDKFIYSKVSNEFYYTRDFGGMFNPKISAVDNFSNVFVFDDKRLRKEYTGTGWKKFSELINSKIFQYMNGDICGPAEAQPEGGIFPSGDIFDYCYINGTNVNLRDSPSLDSNILMQMSFELVKLLEYKSDWIKIETLNGIEAYVYRKYVGFFLSDKICFRKIENEWKIVGYIGGGD